MRRKRIVAYEMGAMTVKEIEVEVEKDTVFWNRAHLVELKEKDADRRKAEGGAAVAAMVKKGDSGKKTDVFYIFNSPQSFVRELVLPKMPLSELDRAIQFQVKGDLPFPLEEAAIGYQISEVRKSGERDLFRISASAVSQKVLAGEIELLRRAGCVPKDVVHTPFSIRRFAEIAGIQPGEIVALIDIGASFSELNIYQNLALKFARKIPVGGNDITEAMANPQTLERAGLSSLNAADIEVLKRERGILASHPSDAARPGMQALQLLASVRPLLERFQNEIRRSFNYFSEEFHGGSVVRVLLFGGGSLLQGLADFLEKRLNVPCQVLRLSSSANLRLAEGLAQNADELPRYYRMFIGLLARLEEKRPLPTLAGIGLDRWLQIAGGVVGAAALLIAVNLWALNFGLSRLERRWGKMSADYERAKGMKELENAVIEKRKRFNEFFLEEPYWEDVFKELSHLVSSNFNLESMNYDNGTLSLVGVYSERRVTKDSLAEFLKALSRGIFENVRLVSTREDSSRRGTFRFHITCQP